MVTVYPVCPVTSPMPGFILRNETRGDRKDWFWVKRSLGRV